MKINCEIVNDLMPLYIEKLTSEESNGAIEEHLKGCYQCRKNLYNSQKNINIKDTFLAEDFNTSDAIAEQTITKIKRKNLKKIIAMLIFVIWMAGFSEMAAIVKYLTAFSPSKALELHGFLNINNPKIVLQEKVDNRHELVVYEDGVHFGVVLLSHRLGKSLWFTKTHSPYGKIVELGKPFEMDAFMTNIKGTEYYGFGVRIADPKISYMVLGDEMDQRFSEELVHPTLGEVKNSPNVYDIKEVKDGYASFYRKTSDYSIFHQLRAYDKEGNLVAHNLTTKVKYHIEN
jgi:hypothetical protein